MTGTSDKAREKHEEADEVDEEETEDDEAKEETEDDEEESEELDVCPGKCAFCEDKVADEALKPDRLMTELMSELDVCSYNHSKGCEMLTWKQRSKDLEVSESVSNEIILALKTELDRTVKAMADLRAEVQTLKLQTETNTTTINTLTANQLKLEEQIAQKDSIIAAAHHSSGGEVEVREQDEMDATAECELKTAAGVAKPGEAPAAEILSTYVPGSWFVAAETGDLATVKQILGREEGFCSDINAVTSKGQTALHLAVLRGHERVAEILLGSARFEAVSMSDNDGNTALHLACLHGREDVVHMLIASPQFKAVSHLNRHGQNALHCAAIQGHCQEAKALLNAKRFSDEAVNALTAEELQIKKVLDQDETVLEHGFTALHLAAKYGHGAVATALLESPRFDIINAMTSDRNYTALYIAALSGSVDVAEALLCSPRFSAANALTEDRESALHVAATHGKAEIIRRLLQCSRFTLASQQERNHGSTALHYAAFHGHAEAARVLLDMDGFPASAVNIINTPGVTAFHLAAGSGSESVLKVFLDSAKVAVNCLDNFGSSAIHTAAFKGHASIVELLLAHPTVTPGANLLNKSGNTALHLAAVQGHAAVAGALLEAERYPDSAVNAGTSRDGSTALHMAVQYNQLQVVRVLLANPRFSAANGLTKSKAQTALHVAAVKGNADIVRALLASEQLKADTVNSMDSSGCSVLHIIAERGHLMAAEALRASGKFTKLHATCHKGRLALDIASARGDARMISFLETWDLQRAVTCSFGVNESTS